MQGLLYPYPTNLLYVKKSRTMEQILYGNEIINVPKETNIFKFGLDWVGVYKYHRPGLEIVPIRCAKKRVQRSEKINKRDRIWLWNFFILYFFNDLNEKEIIGLKKSENLNKTIEDTLYASNNFYLHQSKEILILQVNMKNYRHCKNLHILNI